MCQNCLFISFEIGKVILYVTLAWQPNAYLGDSSVGTDEHMGTAAVCVYGKGLGYK